MLQVQLKISLVLDHFYRIMFFQLQQKCDESTTSSTIARNEYILMLAAANTHQRRYYEADLPQAMGVSEMLLNL